MHGLILAGGEGSRMRNDGIEVPKPLVKVGGRPQISQLVDTLWALGCASVTCLLRDTMPEVEEVLRRDPGGRAATLRWCRTPSSLHTLAEGLRAIPPGPVFCSMTDTVMQPADWRRFYAETRRQLDAGKHAVLAVTPYVDDERPLYVKRDGEGRAIRIGSRSTTPPCVTGGAYGWSPGIRPDVEAACRDGVSRLRAFLQRIVARGRHIGTVEIDRIIDLDGRRDLEQAAAFLAHSSAQAAPVSTLIDQPREERSHPS